MSEFKPGDVVLSKLHRGNEDPKHMLKVRRVSKAGKVQCIGLGHRTITLMPHHLIMIRSK